MDPLLEWRKEFPTLEKTVHLISHSLGAMPRRTRDRLNEYADIWTTRNIRAWEEGWWQMPVTVGNLVGNIIGAGEGEVVMLPNVSIAQSIVNSCLDFSNEKRNKIVTEELNFPTNLYLYRELERLGARLEIVPCDDGMTVPLDRMLAAIDERTLLVSTSHVIFKSAYIQDLAVITKRAHEVGAYIVADIYQSAGTVPVNVRALDVDFATGGSVKWLCGGPGAGYLYVRRDLWPRLEPRVTGWVAHKRPFAFETGEIDYADDAFRFLNGTPAIPALYAARSGYEIINEIGVEKIRAKSLRQTSLLIGLGGRGGISGQHAAEFRAARWNRKFGHTERSTGDQGIAAPRLPGGLPAGRGDPHRPALLYQGRGIELGGRGDTNDSRGERNPNVHGVTYP